MGAGLEGIRSIDQLELENQRVFIRVDFNVPLDKKAGTITDDERIRAALPTLEHAMAAKAKVIVASHLGRPKGKPTPEYGMEPVGQRLTELTGWDVLLPDDCVGDGAKKAVADLRDGQLVLLENLRFHPEEEQNDEGFARELAALADVYVNDAFGAAHRAHASVDALPRMMRERAMGFLMQRELRALERITVAPERPFVALLGGAKVADKIGVLEALLGKCDVLCIGGAMANTLLAARGADMKSSKIEPEQLAYGRTLLDKARDRGVEIVLPVDVVVGESLEAATGHGAPSSSVPAGSMALDIGPATIALFARQVAHAKTVFWNGPMGLFENPAFAAGTLGVAEALASAPGFTVVGGGDSAAALRQAGEEITSKVDFISTGGGAALELLEGKRLPGVEALAAPVKG
ncbi:MAG: phosphoglycerate kinase [Sorangiineae bacterium]|nr:phosphoglycerate kinase [Sorangiineae bacterium]